MITMKQQNKRFTGKFIKHDYDYIINEVMKVYDRGNSFPEGYRFSFPLVVEAKGRTNIIMLLEAKKDWVNFTPVSWIVFPLKKRKIEIIKLDEIEQYLEKHLKTEDLEFPEIKSDESYTLMYSEIRRMGKKIVNDTLENKLNFEEYNYYLLRIKQLVPHHKRKFYNNFPFLYEEKR